MQDQTSLSGMVIGHDNMWRNMSAKAAAWESHFEHLSMWKRLCETAHQEALLRVGCQQIHKGLLVLS